MELTKKLFGIYKDQEVYQFSLKNDHGMEVRVMTFGGIITNIITPDRDGALGDVCLGFDNFDEYLQDHPYLGATVGRYANRIANGEFELDGNKYKLPVNNGPNCLHGGLKGFDKVVWNDEHYEWAEEVGVKLTYLSPDGEEGFPGNVEVQVVFGLTNKNELKIDYTAVTDQKTHVNLTNHSYFNLNTGKNDVLDHWVQINADQYTPADENSIPTGEISDVDNSPLDLREGEILKDKIQKLPEGFDNNYVLNGADGDLKWAAKAKDPLSGRVMVMHTTEPGMQFYTGNFLDGLLEGKGVRIAKQYGFCFEAQHYPDTPNKPQFPSTLLEPGNEYKQLTIYEFSTE